jgi:hypothetical protein
MDEFGGGGDCYIPSTLARASSAAASRTISYIWHGRTIKFFPHKNRKVTERIPNINSGCEAARFCYLCGIVIQDAVYYVWRAVRAGNEEILWRLATMRGRLKRSQFLSIADV